MRHLQRYLSKHSLSQEAFAKQLGVSQGLVWQWLHGRTEITAQRAMDIEQATAGEVTRRDLLPELFREVAR